jgi:hypothetical protein
MLLLAASGSCVGRCYKERASGRDPWKRGPHAPGLRLGACIVSSARSRDKRSRIASSRKNGPIEPLVIPSGRRIMDRRFASRRFAVEHPGARGNTDGALAAAYMDDALHLCGGVRPVPDHLPAGLRVGSSLAVLARGALGRGADFRQESRFTAGIFLTSTEKSDFIRRCRWVRYAPGESWDKRRTLLRATPFFFLVPALVRRVVVTKV